MMTLAFVSFVVSSSAFVLCQQPRSRLQVKASVSSEDGLEIWQRVKGFHVGDWRGVAREVRVDGVLRRAVFEESNLQFTSKCRAKEKTLEEVITWDDGRNESWSGKDLSGDFDASYSADHNARGLRSVPALFATEFAFALGDFERVRVVIAYDFNGYLSKVTVLDEMRIGTKAQDENAAAQGARRTSVDTDLFSLVGEWRGDAVVRSRRGLMVAKQDLIFKKDANRFLRSLTFIDAKGDTIQSFQSFGTEISSQDLNLVVFDDASALLHLEEAGLYVHAPLQIDQTSAFHVEAALFVDEDPESPNAQFPISLRSEAENIFKEDDDPNNNVVGEVQQSDLKQKPQRHLARAVRLYAPHGSLASVTTSYHRHSSAAGAPVRSIF